MRYLVTAFARNPLTQEVFAQDVDEAIGMAVRHPNRWNVPAPSADRADWTFYAMPVDEPQEQQQS